MDKKKIINYLKTKKLISAKEDKVSYMQIFGFKLIILGIIGIIVAAFIDKSAIVAISFFVIMLGVAFAFPTLLEGNEGLSTMRIVVFMMINVICILLLKFGWGKNSLIDIGLDGWWMGVIAFTFGAKATQAYFENVNKLIPKTQSIPQEKQITTETIEGKNIDFSQIAIAQLAKVQNEGRLYSSFINIQSVSDTLKNGKSCLTLYVNDDNIKGFPSFVNAQLNETWSVKVQTEIISNSGAAIIHIGQASDELSDSNNPKGFGSICCLLESTDNPSLKFIVTAGHNFTEGNFKSMGGFVFDNDQRDVLINSAVRGKLFYQRMHFTQDLAIVLITDSSNLMKNYISFEAGYYELSVKDIKTDTPNVTIASRINEQRTGPNIRNAFILDHNIPFDVMYNGEKIRMQNVILIGDSNDPQKSKEISMRGDSGSCVFHKDKDTNQLVGILIGGNGQFSFVLPIKEILESNNFKLV
ncbi:MAG: hypothetical protein JHC39_10455 [Lentimicrobium sp.]|nr:hypothetical protein [Lentimicrobium sp.]